MEATLTNNNRSSIIKFVQYHANGHAGPDACFVVDMYQDGKLIESRALPGKNKHYAEDVAENWENGIIMEEK